MVLPHSHILRHVTSGLPQKPHWRSVHRQAQASSHKAASFHSLIDNLPRCTIYSCITQETLPRSSFEPSTSNSAAHPDTVWRKLMHRISPGKLLPANPKRGSRLTFKPKGKLFNHRVYQHFTRNPFHLGLRGVLFQSIIQSQQKILSLPYIGNAAILHSPQCICNRLPLGIQHRSF